MQSGFRTISFTVVILKVHEWLVSSRLYAFMEIEVVISWHHIANRKRLGICDALLDIVCADKRRWTVNGNELIANLF